MRNISELAWSGSLLVVFGVNLPPVFRNPLIRHEPTAGILDLGLNSAEIRSGVIPTMLIQIYRISCVIRWIAYLKSIEAHCGHSRDISSLPVSVATVSSLNPGFSGCMGPTTFILLGFCS